MIELGDIPPHAREGILRLVAEMSENGVERDAPERAVAAMLGDRWSALVLLVLETGEWRHADLRRVLCRISAEKAISQRVLTLKLRGLEREGFVDRHATADVPPKVSYWLTDMGKELVDELRRMLDWISARHERILKARERFDAAEQG